MKIDVQQLAQVLHKQGWQPMPLTDVAREVGLGLFCVSPLAAMGLMVVNSTGEITSRWADGQEQMSRLRRTEAVGKNRDLYLAFVVENGDRAAESLLQPVLGDTHVCRKVYIALNGRSVEEALQNIPFFQAATRVVEPKDEKIVPLIEGLDLPVDLQQDLAARGPAKILDNLMEGKYTQPEGHK